MHVGILSSCKVKLVGKADIWGISANPSCAPVPFPSTAVRFRKARFYGLFHCVGVRLFPPRSAGFPRKSWYRRYQEVIREAAFRRPAAGDRADREGSKKISVGWSHVLFVLPNGSTLWRFSCTFAGRPKTHAIGACPAIRLAEARAVRRGDGPPQHGRRSGRAKEARCD